MIEKNDINKVPSTLQFAESPNSLRRRHEALLAHMERDIIEDCRWLQTLVDIPAERQSGFHNVLLELDRAREHVFNLLAEAMYVAAGHGGARESADIPLPESVKNAGDAMLPDDVILLPEHWLQRNGESEADKNDPGIMLPLATRPDKAKQPQGTRLYGRPPIVLDEEKKLLRAYLHDREYFLTQEEWEDLLKKISRLIKNAPIMAIGLEIRVVRTGDVKALNIQYRSFHQGG